MTLTVDDRELIEAICAEANEWAMSRPVRAHKLRAAADRLQSLLSDRDRLEQRVREYAYETARQRAVVLFQAYARGVSERHGRSEKQFIFDVNAFTNELTAALRSADNG